MFLMARLPKKFILKLFFKKRKLHQVNSMAEIGFRVIRGPDWKWDNQDGGDGHVGTVVEVGRSGNRSSPDKTVIVQWDNGRKTNYRVGYKGAYDLLVFDGAPAGVKHLNKRCDGCGRRGIKGIRWQCTQCEDYDLCTRCYMDNRHNTQHSFRRFLTSKSTGVLIPKRSKSKRSRASGIFPGAKVIRGCDWIWENQDGGVGKIGSVTETRGWQNESDSSVAAISWPGSRSNLYRVGHRGKMDVKYVVPGKGPLYYKDHLPELGKDVLDPALVPPVKPCPFVVGDRVRVCLSVDVLQQMQMGHGGWIPKMANLIGVIGIVHRITQAGDVRVQYPLGEQRVSGGRSSSSSSDTNRWTFNPAALTKAVEGSNKQFLVGSHVRVIEDFTRVKNLQSSEHGNWNEKMKECLGKKGKIVEVYADGDVRVEFTQSRVWTFNPACLLPDASRHVQGLKNIEMTINSTAVTDGAGILGISRDPQDPTVASDLLNSAITGDLQEMRQILHLHPESVDAKFNGSTALQVAAYGGKVDIVKFLLSKSANISIVDVDGDGALHCAMAGKENPTECVRLILEKATFSDVNLVNYTKRSTLHSAVIMNNIEWVEKILNLGCNVNLQDDEGDTAAHCCVTNQDNPELLRLLLTRPNFNPEVANNRRSTILHTASLRGQYCATELILELHPQLAATSKEDGMTALHLSVMNEHERITQLLINKCPSLVHKADLSGHTPLYFASSYGSFSMVDMLVKAGAIVNVCTEDGKTGLHAALEKYIQESGENFNSFSDDMESSAMLTSSGDFSMIGSFPQSTIWKEIRDILLRYSPWMLDNVTHLAIACYLTAVSIEQNPAEEDYLFNAFKIVSNDDKATKVLREFYKLKSPRNELASEFSKVGFTETPTSNKLSASLVLPQSSLRYSSRNYVKSSTDDEVNRNVIENQECLSCAEEIATVIFKPCGHKIVCLECCVRMKKCIECHQIITDKVDEEGRSLTGLPSVARSSIMSVVEQQETVMQLEKKVRELQESNQCIICMEKQRDTALKCGHRFCQKCAVTLRKHCPICRKPITGTIRLY